ncbi:2-succinyl-5-enolpyruvyl-6-hydroxy-3-cyclohexene-1-carboxylic-acid synthase [Occultella glacieicola]|uniref:2-succinyl-5-enolpyruvyl-6-hydroxy-3-cyclohexene-1-carboxylate synthase n=1 Tax=Occultella glacieicola TaxID=2518684 RepID=A0ABY2E1G7_9MICO|nr:2-succinyl-5-enolpyruvyl-6-hydroxy-3-cyclohexene-1-carboxylic-acid synthase [Occultella glacieicola]
MPSAATARALVGELVAAGVRDVVLAPGSRSAPLAYALLAAERAGWLRLHVRVDERSAGFVALGIARVRPAAVVTTSGTAVANLHPAVLEASHSGAPLLVLSADRPHELRGVGANQTTDQADLFGSALRWSGEIPADDAVPARGVRTAVVRAVAAARGLRSAHPGPVQLNVAFRDPLAPGDDWVPGPPPTTSTELTPAAVSAPTVLDRGPRTVIVAGDGAGAAAVRLAAVSGWPVLAEPGSGARHTAAAVSGYRVLLAHPGLGPRIERVVVLGRPTLSRPVSALLARTEPRVVVVGPGPDWVDVAGNAAAVHGAVDVAGEITIDERAWAGRWALASAAAERALADDPTNEAVPTAERSGPMVPDPLDGARVARAVLEAGGTVMLGSSMAIRDADLAAPVGAGENAARVFANRGLAGIDGTISTATGLALATGSPVRALIGDLTFQHDVGGLARGRLEPEVDLQVIVLNDDGGSIFATLEHGTAAHAEDFDRLFGTPQGLDLGALAAGFGARHRVVATSADLAAALADPGRGRSVVEVRLDGGTARARALALTGRIGDAVAAALADAEPSTNSQEAPSPGRGDRKVDRLK